jgi:hypothetical protein
MQLDLWTAKTATPKPAPLDKLGQLGFDFMYTPQKPSYPQGHFSDPDRYRLPRKSGRTARRR